MADRLSVSSVEADLVGQKYIEFVEGRWVGSPVHPGVSNLETDHAPNTFDSDGSDQLSSVVSVRMPAHHPGHYLVAGRGVPINGASI